MTVYFGYTISEIERTRTRAEQREVDEQAGQLAASLARTFDSSAMRFLVWRRSLRAASTWVRGHRVGDRQQPRPTAGEWRLAQRATDVCVPYNSQGA
jgi:hypothetical protein